MCRLMAVSPASRTIRARCFWLVSSWGPSGQPAAPPPTLNVTNANSNTSFSPLIGQQFFIGDGRPASNALQTFNVPRSATTLYLGFAESFGFGRLFQVITATMAGLSRSMSKQRAGDCDAGRRHVECVVS